MRTLVRTLHETAAGTELDDIQMCDTFALQIVGCNWPRDELVTCSGCFSAVVQQLQNNR